MAQEQIIRIQTGDAVRNVQDLKENIAALKENLKTLDIGSQEYKNTLVDLQANQAALRNAMHGTTASMQDVMNAATGVNVTFNEQNQLVDAETLSYNELVRALDVLKQEWRTLTDEQERAQLGEKINSVNDRLKEMDASVGNYQRNVGNYLGALQQWGGMLGGLGPKFSSMVGPIRAVDTSLKTLSVNPVIGILGLLAVLITAVVKELKSFEEGTNALNKATAPLAGVMDELEKGFQALALSLVKVIELFGQLTEYITGTNEATQKRLELAEMERLANEKNREVMMANAEDERQLAQDRLNMMDKERFSEEERLGFAQHAREVTARIAQRNLEYRQMEYERIKRSNSLTKSHKRDLDAEAQAYVALKQAQIEYLNMERTIMRQENRIGNEIARSSGGGGGRRSREDARKAELQAYQSLLQQEIKLLVKGSEERLAKEKELALKEYESAVQEAKNKIKNRETLNRQLAVLQQNYNLKLEELERNHQQSLLDIRLQALTNIAAQYAKGTLDNLRAIKDLRKAELDTMLRKEGETEEDYAARRLAAQWAYYEAVREFNKKVYDERTADLELAFAQSKRTEEQRLAFEKQMAEARLETIKELGREAAETEAEYLIRVANAEAEVRKTTDAVLDYQEKQARLRLENDLAALDEDSMAYLAKAIEVKKYELDTLHQLEAESDEDFRTRQLAAQKAYTDAQKALWQQQLSTAQQVAGILSGILGSIADMYEANTNASKKETERMKNLRIAGAVIDMLSGAVTAYTTAQKLGPPQGPIIGAINAAAVVAAGIANIAKMKAQQISTESSATETPAVVQAPDYTPDVQQVRTITGASEEERLNQMANQRVYILNSDLEAAAGSTRAQVAETTF